MSSADPDSLKSPFQIAKAWVDRRVEELNALTPAEREVRERAAVLEEEREQDLRRQARRMTLLNEIPGHFRSIPFDWPGEVAKWVGQLLNYGPQRVPSLVLAGPTGVGKTAVACMVLRAAIEGDLRGRIQFVTFRSLLRRLRPGGDATSEVLEQLCEASLVCLDDVGAHKGSEWAEEQLLEIVDERYNWERPLVITVNIDPKDFSQYLGERVGSRLSEMCQVVTMVGPDRRMVTP